jgi:hypothetical protein
VWSRPNSLFEKVGGNFVSCSFGRVALTNRGANKLLSEAVENLNSSDSRSSAKSIAVPSNGEDAAIVVHVLPVRRSAHNIFGAAKGVLVVTPLGSFRSLPDRLLKGLFDLSPAEIRAADGLLKQKTDYRPIAPASRKTSSRRNMNLDYIAISMI